MTTAAVPSTNPVDFLLNVETLDRAMNSTELTFTDRLGNSKSTLSAAIDSIKSFNNRGAWAATTFYAVKDLVIVSGSWYVCVVPHTSSAAFATDTASKWRVHQGLTTADVNTVVVAQSNIFSPASGGTDTRGVELTFNATKGALRYGGSDPLPTNDERNYWAGITSKNAWGTPANIGLYSTAFNRNGMSVGTYSNTFGHDCIAMGTASLAGGAGSATGNEADPLNTGYAFNGYCAFTWGKNNIVRGEKSFALGEEGQANSRSSGVFGYLNTAGAGTTAHPNSQGASGVVSDGIGAMATGHTCKAYGDGAQAVGRFVASYNGAQTLGSGINPGTPMVNEFPLSVGLGANVIRPTFTTLPGDGTVGDKGKSASRSDYYCMVDVNATKDVLGASLGAVVTNTGSGGYAKPVLKGLRSGALATMMEVDPVTMIPKFFGNAINFGTQRTVVTSNETGTQGDICWDVAYIYICVSTNTWKRIANAGW